GCALLIRATWTARSERRGLIRGEGPCGSPHKAAGRIRGLPRCPGPTLDPGCASLIWATRFRDRAERRGLIRVEGPSRSPDKAAGRIGGPRQFPTLTRPPDALRLSGLRDFSALLERGRSTACARKHG